MTVTGEWGSEKLWFIVKPIWSEFLVPFFQRLRGGSQGAAASRRRRQGLGRPQPRARQQVRRAERLDRGMVRDSAIHRDGNLETLQYNIVYMRSSGLPGFHLFGKRWIMRKIDWVLEWLKRTMTWWRAVIARAVHSGWIVYSHNSNPITYSVRRGVSLLFMNVLVHIAASTIMLFTILRGGEKKLNKCMNVAPL